MTLPIIASNSARPPTRIVAEQYHGELGKWVYKAFDWVNHKHFHDELPEPLLVLALTPYGGCLGYTSTPALPDGSLDASRGPTILLHPALFGSRSENGEVWGIPLDLLGKRIVLDLIIHESMHAYVNYRLGGWKGTGTTSHNNERWIAEVNRIAPVLGFKGIAAGMNKPKRVGKKIRRISTGNVPFVPCVTSFPYGLRRYLNQSDYYRDPAPLPFEDAECNAELEVTDYGNRHQLRRLQQ